MSHEPATPSRADILHCSRQPCGMTYRPLAYEFRPQSDTSYLLYCPEHGGCHASGWCVVDGPGLRVLVFDVAQELSPSHVLTAPEDAMHGSDVIRWPGCARRHRRVTRERDQAPSPRPGRARDCSDDLGNMRSREIQRVEVACTAADCSYSRSLSVTKSPGEFPLPDIGARLTCPRCGAPKLEGPPNWSGCKASGRS